MPVATIDPNEYQRFDLKTLPSSKTEEGGYVMLRPMPYGMRLERRDKASTMKMRAIEGRATGRGRQTQQDGAGEITIETASEWSTLFDYKYCIGEHNLTDVNGVPLDLSNALTLKSLNPRVGAEIEQLLFDLNEEEGAESLEDFLQRSVSSSETAAPSLDTASGALVSPANEDS